MSSSSLWFGWLFLIRFILFGDGDVVHRNSPFLSWYVIQFALVWLAVPELIGLAAPDLVCHPVRLGGIGAVRS